FPNEFLMSSPDSERLANPGHPRSITPTMPYASPASLIARKEPGILRVSLEGGECRDRTTHKPEFPGSERPTTDWRARSREQSGRRPLLYRGGGRRRGALSERDPSGAERHRGLERPRLGRDGSRAGPHPAREHAHPAA